MWYKSQRVLSENEKQLGLGIVQDLDINQQIITINFPLAQETRSYSLRNPAIRRYLLKINQTFLIEKKEYTVEKVSFHDNLAQYHCSPTRIIWEYELDPSTTEDHSVVEGLIYNNWSPFSSYDLRKEGFLVRKNLSQDRLSGLITSRVDLLPHQIYLANKISGEQNPRVLLADEVGLGKTIEAGLIFACLNSLEKAERVLIVVPESLIHQWAYEFSKSFGTLFSVFDDSRYKEEEKSLNLSPFEANSKIIISLEELLTQPEKALQASKCSWDLLIVDEAHHLEWEPDHPSDQWKIVNRISGQSKSLLLLTATPRQRGLTTQYGLLHMIDPKKFCNFKDFVIEMELLDQVAQCAKDISESKTIATKTRDQLKFLFQDDTELIKDLSHPEKLDPDEMISKLIDRHGTGRVIYRNRKCNLSYFPKRQLIFESIEATEDYKNLVEETNPDDLAQKTLMHFATGRRVDPIDNKSLGPHHDKRTLWLANYLKKTHDKTFVICSSKKRAIEIACNLESLLNLDALESKKMITVFHEDKPTITRDQEAVFFANPRGSRVLISSEIGGEGRNFQFVKNIVLLDLPLNPETLEQRIGRLDRIGQGSTIHIYIPILKNTPEEVLFRWYHEGLNAFLSQSPSHGLILENLAEEIIETIACFFPKHKNFSSKNKKLNSLIKETKVQREEISKELEETQDILLDLNSFNSEKTQTLIEKIDQQEDNPLVESFVLSSLNYLGIDYEDYDTRGSVKVNFDSLSFVDNLPFLGNTQDSVLTFDRQVFLKQEHTYFMAFPSKLVQIFLDMATKGEQGKFSLCSMDTSLRERKVYLQILFTLETKGPKHLEFEKYLPFNTKEFLIDSKGNKLKTQIKTEDLNQIKDSSQYVNMIKSQKFIDILTKNIEALQKNSLNWKEDAIAQAKQKLTSHYKKEISHLEYLIKINPMYTTEDLDLCHKKFSKIENCIINSKLNFDSVRVILVNP